MGQGETINTSAHLSNEIDATYREIARLHLEKGARMAAESHTAAISKIESIVAEEDIDCEFARVDGYLFLGPDDSEKTLDQELEAAQRAGVNVAKEQTFSFGLTAGPCLRFPQQAQFHPAKYMAGLARAFKRAGGKIYGKTEAKEIKGGEPAEVKTAKGRTITAASRGGRHEYAGQRLGDDAHEASGLPHLCDWRAGAARFNSNGSLLGHRRSVFILYACNASAKAHKRVTYSSSAAKITRRGKTKTSKIVTPDY